MPTKGTPATPIRLTAEDKAKVEGIRERMGLPSAAAAIRYAIDREHRRASKAK